MKGVPNLLRVGGDGERGASGGGGGSHENYTTLYSPTTAPSLDLVLSPGCTRHKKTKWPLYEVSILSQQSYGSIGECKKSNEVEDTNLKYNLETYREEPPCEKSRDDHHLI